MIPLLQQLCCEKLATMKTNNIKNKSNHICYNKVVDEHIKKGFDIWKTNIKLVNYESELEYINILPDMLYGEYNGFFLIEIKQKNSFTNERKIFYSYNDESHELCSLYNIYYIIADKKGLVDAAIHKFYGYY